MNLTEQQWGALFLALGQVPTIDVAMNCDDRETRVLNELARKGLDWQQRGFLHYGTGDRLDALDLAQRLGIDPATAEPVPAKSEDQMQAELSREWFDEFMDMLTRVEGV
ncbi:MULTISPECIES: hypothetical protein [unclassified Thiomonas]|jgi:hypothetical protein|uniref:hypothetical protein n=1 Tax=unclassified Thiomonas TaxID=2625466 RepID=UPI000BC8B5BC|nr:MULTISPECIES: hypothetical protein [unclassified Thiomonas]OZB72187.1 MAG: hypothetical protein B7X30_00955 [Thiomonas sp. 13-64-67]